MGLRNRLIKVNRFIKNYLSKNPCIDCGEKDPLVLEFDHVRGRKKGGISDLKRYSSKILLKEIAKCEVRCANCHRRKTLKDLKSTKIYAS